MTRFVSSVVALTEVRDGDDLLETFAATLVDLTGARQVTVWNIVHHEGLPKVGLRVRARCRGSHVKAEILAEHGDRPAPEDLADLLACHAARVPRHRRINEALHASVFLLDDDLINANLVEVQHSKALTRYELRLIDGLLRIHRNHTRTLDIGLRDQLTGLLNRRTFDESFLRLRDTQQSLGKPYQDFENDGQRRPHPSAPSWLVVLDIDHFKRINDTFGHLYGDEVLVLLARLLGTVFRETDRIFRFGGEEFVVIVSNVGGAGIGGIVERCRTAVEEFTFPQVGDVTISLGYTRICLGDSGSSAFGRADKALYAAKQDGRNRAYAFEDLFDLGRVSEPTELRGDLELL